MSIGSHARLRRLIAPPSCSSWSWPCSGPGSRPGPPSSRPRRRTCRPPSRVRPGYTPQTSCDPTAKPGTLRLARLLTSTYPETRYGTVRACGPTPNSEHHDGRAVDWMVSVRSSGASAPRPTAVLAWLLATDAEQNAYAMARRLGVMYLIWNNRIWSASRADEGWRPYSDCANHPETVGRQPLPPQPHPLLPLLGGCPRRHLLLDRTGRQARLRSVPTGRSELGRALRRVQPHPLHALPAGHPPAGASSTLRTLVTYSGRILREGTTGVAVKAVQTVVGVSTTGTFGPGHRTGAEALAGRPRAEPHRRGRPGHLAGPAEISSPVGIPAVAH